MSGDTDNLDDDTVFTGASLSLQQVRSTFPKSVFEVEDYVSSALSWARLAVERLERRAK